MMKQVDIVYVSLILGKNLSDSPRLACKTNTRAGPTSGKANKLAKLSDCVFLAKQEIVTAE